MLSITDSHKATVIKTNYLHIISLYRKFKGKNPILSKLSRMEGYKKVIGGSKNLERDNWYN